MEFLDRKSAIKFAGYGLSILLLVFMTVIIFLWWFEVFKFFLYDHWRPTAWFVACCGAWYVIGRAIERMEETRAMNRRHADPNYYGDDDCA